MFVGGSLFVFLFEDFPVALRKIYVRVSNIYKLSLSARVYILPLKCSELFSVSTPIQKALFVD